VYYTGLLMAASTVAWVNGLIPLHLAAGLAAAMGVAVVIGWYDERSRLSSGPQLIAQLVIALAAVMCGWTIPYVSNPLHGGVIVLSVLGPLLTVGWLVVTMNAINWFDGSDGLAGGVSLVGLTTLAAISLLPATHDAMTLGLALVGIGSVLAFLVWNYPPAHVYLGTTGSWFVGVYLGLVAIIGGGKIATALLVLALPVLDVGFVVIARLRHGQPPWVGDTRYHIHNRLAARGWSPRQIALSLTGISALFGLAALTLQTSAKLGVFAASACVAGAIIFVIL